MFNYVKIIFGKAIFQPYHENSFAVFLNHQIVKTTMKPFIATSSNIKSSKNKILRCINDDEFIFKSAIFLHRLTCDCDRKGINMSHATATGKGLTQKIIKEMRKMKFCETL